MSSAQVNQANGAITDRYPSRQGGVSKFLSREDPVVYGCDLSSAPLTQTQIESYRDDGFVVLKDVFSEHEVAMFHLELDQMRQDEGQKTSAEAIREPGSGDIRSIFRIHASNPVFKVLAADERLVNVARFLLNDDVYIHQSRLNYKPGFRGKEFYWHSDFETWHVEDGMPAMRALSMSLPLTDNYQTNGPLMLIPGSHKRYVACEGQTPDNHFQVSLKKQDYGIPSDDCLKALADSGGIVSVPAEPGSVIVFDCNTMHGSNGNITPYARSNAFIVYNAMTNRVLEPFCDQPPRPEYICSREEITPI